MTTVQALAAIALAFAISFGICSQLERNHRRDIAAGKAQEFGHSGSGLGLLALLGGVGLSVIFLLGLALMMR